MLSCLHIKQVKIYLLTSSSLKQIEYLMPSNCSVTRSWLILVGCSSFINGAHPSVSPGSHWGGKRAGREPSECVIRKSERHRGCRIGTTGLGPNSADQRKGAPIAQNGPKEAKSDSRTPACFSCTRLEEQLDKSSTTKCSVNVSFEIPLHVHLYNKHLEYIVHRLMYFTLNKA